MLAMLTMRPHPRSIMPGTTARVTLKMPCTFTSNVRAHSSGATSHIGSFGPTIPALLIRMSTRPTAATAALDRGEVRHVDALVGVGRHVERDHVDAVGSESGGAGGAEPALRRR